MFRKLKSVLRDLRAPTQSERDYAYLAEATSLVDLEARQRHLDLARIGKGPNRW